MMPGRGESADLSRFNSFAISACARRLVQFTHPAQIPDVARLLRDESDWLILGAGSNVLFTDDFDGTVVRVGLRGRAIVATQPCSTDADRVIVSAAAGESWSDLVDWTLSEGLFGLENLSLIPGSVGAAPVQNIGAYGVEISECIDGVEALNLADGKVYHLSREDCGLRYRDSVFKRAGTRPHWLILSVRLALSRTPRPRLHYADLARAFAGRTALPSPHEVAQTVCHIRRSKLPDPLTLANAGSFFRNPVIDRAAADALATHHPGIKMWPEDGQPDSVRLAAGWLIEQCGWKGYRRGDAGVHADHALVLVNHGRARGRDIALLAEDIQQSVQNRFGVRLDPEVVII